jgi:hypothetical protein
VDYKNKHFSDAFEAVMEGGELRIGFPKFCAETAGLIDVVLLFLSIFLLSCRFSSKSFWLHPSF